MPRNLFDSNHFVEDMSSPLVVPAIPQFSKAVNYVAAQLRILRKEKKHEIEEKKKKKNNNYKPHDFEALIKDVASRTVLEMKPHIMTIADVNKIVDTALEGMLTLEMKLREKIEEIRTTTLTAVYDVANDIEANVLKDHLKYRTKFTEDIAFVERQAETNNTNMITLKDAVNEALGHLTGGRISIDLDLDIDVDSDSDSDDEG